MACYNHEAQVRSRQIHLSLRAKLLSLALLAAVLTGGCSKGDEPKASSRPPLPVQVKTLESQTVRDSTEFVGTLESEQTLNLVPQINGQITKLLVKSGSQVKRGTTMVVIAPDQTVPQFQSALETVQANVATRETAIANLSAARGGLDTAIANLSAARGDLDAAIATRDEAIQQAQAKKSQLGAAKKEYELAKFENQAVQYLAAKKVDTQLNAEKTATKESVTKDNVTTAQKELAAAKQQVAAAQGQVAAAQGKVAAAQGQVAATQGQVAAAQSSINQAGANIRQAQAQANSAKVNVDLKKVTAPINGSVGNITLKVGDYVNTNTVLTTINQNNAFDLQIPVPLSRAGQLRRGLPVQLLDPNTGEDLASGSLYFVSSTTDAKAQAIMTRARFSNPDGKLRNSQYVKARIIWESQPGVLVPALAVTTIGPQNFVFVSQEKSTDGKTEVVARQVPVTLGQMQGQSYQVVSGLKPGDKVIVSDILKLRDGAPIAPRTGI
jgi:RND family efflux transporter MFP subunit